MNHVAIIGGSGIYKMEKAQIVEELSVQTPFGRPSSLIKKIRLSDDQEFFFLSRHGEGHYISPSEINYQANIYALKELGVSTIISISAVGSLKEEHQPTKFVLPSQFIDWTKGLRKRTFFSNGMVGHVSVANPVEVNLQKRLANLMEKEGVDFSYGGSYICIEGPQFSTKAESNIYRSFGADIIGMTNVPEAYLAKEAAMAYSTLAMVTDYDCWREDHCDAKQIMEVMQTNYKKVQQLIPKFIANLNSEPIKFTPENQYAVMTDKSLLTDDQKKILDVLLK